MEHQYYECPPDKHENEDYYGGCPFCDGGLGLCIICGGLEGSLTSECYGKQLDENILELIYKKGLDFKNDHWTIKETT